MPFFLKARHIVLAFGVMALIMLLAKPGRTAASAWEGRLEDVVGDAQGFKGKPRQQFSLVTADGQRKRVRISRELLNRSGGVRHLRGKQVRLEPRAGAALTVEDGLPSTEIQGLAALGTADAQSLAAEAITGSKPWLAILVRFGDNASTPHPRSWFVDRLTVPNQFMDKIWRENSYDQINVVGSQVAGWYTLPRPRSYYVYDNNGDGQEDADLGRIGDDALALADNDVYFPSFSGVQVMINDGMGCCAWGGARNINRDGVDRSYSFTWMPPWAFEQLGVLAHEMGHGFGLPHSSGPYNQTYDSKWDFMSSAYGDNPPHTISYHKDKLDWFGAGRRYDPAVGSTQDIFIERMAFMPKAAGTYAMARLPISGTDKFYTVESRHKVGYDASIPAEGVVIHDVDFSRDSDALVVDADNNGDVNDAGACWTPGEVFNDAANQIRVEVLSSNANGDWVRISYKANTPPPPPANGNGVCATYWSNRTLNGGACAMRTESAINLNYGSGGPGGGICGNATDNFSARFSGQLEAPYAGVYTLYATADDGVRLWVSNPANGAESLLIDQWQDRGATEYAAVLPFSLNQGQKAAFRLEYYEAGGDAVAQLAWSGPNVPKAAIPQGRLYSGSCALPTPTPTLTPTPWPANGNGVCASYWGNQSLAGTACAMRTEANVNNEWGTGGPAGLPCGDLVDHFSARYVASLEAPYTGVYTLSLSGDDGIRLWATNPSTGVESLLIDQWKDQGTTEYSATLPFSLNAGQKAPLRVEYYENGVGAVVVLRYEGPNTPKQVIPQGRLYSAACALPTSTPTFSSTRTPTRTPTSTATVTRSATNTATVTTPPATSTPTHTDTNTGTAMRTATSTGTATATPTWTNSPTSTATATRSNTAVPPTATATFTATRTWTATSTNTRSNTPVPPTATLTRTSTPVTPAGMTLKYKNVDTAATSASPYPQFLLTNSGSNAEQLSVYEIRYWLTCDCNGAALQAWLDWSGAGGALVDLVSTNLGGQTHYLRVRFTQSVQLSPGASVEVHTRFNRGDWSPVTQSNDWSFAPYGGFTTWNHVTLYRNGVKVFGLEPTGSAPGAAVSSLPGGKALVAGPNPATDEVQLAFQGGDGGMRLAVYNLNQELVVMKDLGVPGPGEQSASLTVRELATGLYWMSLQENVGGTWVVRGTFKAVVKH